MKKFLIIRFSSIGDIVLTSPVVRCLKAQIPDAEIHFVTKSAYKTLLENNPYIDKVHCLNTNMSSLTQVLKNEAYHCIIDLHNNIRSRLLSYKLGNKTVRFNKLNIEKWLLVNFKINKMPDRHIVGRYMDTLSAFGVVYDNKGLDYFPAQNYELAAAFKPDKPYIAWVIGGKHETKIFPEEKVKAIASRLSLPVYLLGDQYDAERGRYIADGQASVVNLCGALDIDGSVRIIKDAALVLANDTGFMHIAAAYKKKIISFWGNTVPEFGMYPFLPDGLQQQSVMFEIKDLKCRPCSKIGYKQCPKKHFRCMAAIEEDAVLQAVESLLKQ